MLDEDAEPLGPEIVPEHECDDRARRRSSRRRRRSVTFTGAGIGTTLTNTISYFPGQGGPVGDVYDDLLEDCAQVVVDDAGLRFTTKPLDFGVLSDDTLPLVVVLEYDDGTIEERNLIVMRAGDLISTIRLDGPRPTDLERARRGHPRRDRQPRRARPGHDLTPGVGLSRAAGSAAATRSSR